MRPHSLLLTCAALFTSCGMSEGESPIVSQKFIHKYGFDLTEEEWEARDQDGQVVLLLENGVKVTRTFENGILHGPSTFTFPSSDVVEKVHVYDHGTLLKQLVNNASGLPMREEIYEFDDRVVITLWDEKGVPLSIEEYEGDRLREGSYYTPDHVLEAKVAAGLGERVKRDHTGLLLSRDSIEGGTMTARTTYHPNGQIHTISHYDHAQLHGEQLKFTSSGRPLMALNWDHGVLSGPKTVFRNGQKVAEIPYVNGVKEGTEFHFDDLGNMTAEIQWQGDKKHGVTRFHTDETTETEWFFNGKSVSAERFQLLDSRERMVTEMGETLDITSESE